MADLLDVVTLAEAKAILSVSATDTSRDADVERLITAVSRRLDTLVGPVVRRAVTDEKHDGGRTVIELAHGPASAVATVIEHAGTTSKTLTEETVGTEPAEGWFGERYDPDPILYSGMIVRRVGGSDSRFEAGRGNVVVTYTAGRHLDTASVDKRFREAAGIMLRNLWRPYQESVGGVGEFDSPVQNFPGFAVPNAVLQLLSDEVIPEVGFGA